MQKDTQTKLYNPPIPSIKMVPKQKATAPKDNSINNFPELINFKRYVHKKRPNKNIPKAIYA